VPDQRLQVTLSARDQLSPVLKKVGVEAETAGRKAEDAGKRATRSTQDWGRAASAVGAALGVGIAASIKIFNEAEVVQTRLRQSVENTGAAYEEYADSIDKAADSALQLAFDDEDALNAISALTDATGNAQTAINDLALAEDIARGRGIDLAAATNIVIAAETGRFASLKRLGIQVDENATKEEVLAGLQAKYAGQAEAYAKTNQATWDRIGNTIENRLESIGGALADFQGPILALSTAGVALGPLSDAFTAIDGKAKIARVSSLALGAALSPAGLAIGALGAAAGITYLINQMNRYDDAAETAARSTLDLSNFFKSLAASLDPANQRIIRELGENLDQIISDAAQRQSDLDKLITLQLGITNEGIDISTQAAAELAAETTGLTVEQLKWIDGNRDLRITIDEVNSSVELFQRNLDRLNADQVKEVQANIQSLFSKSNLDYEKASAAINDLNNQLDAGMLTPEQYVQAISDLATNYGDLITGMAADTEDATVRMRRSWGGMALMFPQTLAEISKEFAAFQKTLGDTGDTLITTFADSEKALDGVSESALGADSSLTGAAVGFERAISGAQGATEATAELDTQLAALSDTLEADLPGAATAAYQRVVGFTSGMVSAIKTSKDWADALIAPVGTFSELDNMLSRGLIDIEDYNEAQNAQIDLTNDLARATDAANIIQVKQADTVAEGARQTADYLETLSKMPEAQQELALAWADTDVAGQAMEVANLSASYDEMNATQQEAFANMVESAANTNPALAAVLSDMKLIELQSDGTYELKVPTDNAKSDTELLIDAINRLTAAITGVPDVEVATHLDTGGFWAAWNQLPSFKAINVYTTGGYGPTPDLALGGIVDASHGHLMETAALGRVSGGRMTLVGENGPELAMLPGGTHVLPNHATRYDGRVRDRGGAAVVIQNMTVVANDPQTFMRQMRTYSSTMERR